MHIRYLIRRDTTEVLALDTFAALEFGEWPEPLTEDTLRAFSARRNAIGRVVECEGPNGAVIAGYLLYELHMQTLVVRRLYVDRYFRRQGVGAQMLASLAKSLNDRRCRLVVPVPDSMLDAHLWLRACGLRARVEGRHYVFSMVREFAAV